MPNKMNVYTALRTPSLVHALEHAHGRLRYTHTRVRGTEVCSTHQRVKMCVCDEVVIWEERKDGSAETWGHVILRAPASSRI
jgi:hypothetical protein